MNAVFWRKDKYTAVDKDTFWLSETPDTQSKYDGAGCNRICTWVLLRETETGKLLLHMNTHLDNASSEAANFGARLIMQRMQALSEKYPQAQIVLTGDFNQNRGMAAYNAVAAEPVIRFPLFRTGQTEHIRTGVKRTDRSRSILSLCLMILIRLIMRYWMIYRRAM